MSDPHTHYWARQILILPDGYTILYKRCHCGEVLT